MAEPWKKYQAAPKAAEGPWAKYAKPKEDKGLFASVRDFFTGESRQTDATREMGEFDLPFELVGPKGNRFRQPRTALGLLTTFRPEDQIAVLKENYPELTFSEDEAGNIIVDGSAYGAKPGILNMPGVSPRDLLQAGFQVAAFTPAGRAATAATMPARALQAGGAGALIQGAQDVAAQASGRDENVSLSNIRAGDVATAGAFSAGGQAVFDLLAKGLNRFFQARPDMLVSVQSVDDVTPDIRKAAQEAYKALGGNPAQLSDEAIVAAFNSFGLSDDVARNAARGMPVDDAARAATQQARDASQRTGIELSRGQASGSPRQLQMEEAIRSGGLGGEGARGLALAQQARQQAQTVQAARSLQRQAGGGQRTVGAVNDASDIVTDAVRSKADDLYRQVTQAYDDIPGDVALTTDGARKLFAGMNRALRGADVARDLPQTAATLRDIRGVTKTLETMQRNNARIPLRQLENFRKRLNTRIASADPGDARQLIQVKAAFDEYLDDAVANGLVRGGDDAADALGRLKHARELRRHYSELFEPQPSRTRAGVRDNDAAGRLINKMAELDPSTEEVTKALFGSGRVFGRHGSERIVSRLKNVLGPDSPEFKSIREAAVLRLMGAEAGQLDDGVRISGREFLKRVREARAGRSESLGKALFSDDELAAMEDLARHIVRTQPERFNPSGTAGQIGFQLRESLGRMGGILGLSNGDPTMVVLSAFANRGSQGLKDGKVVRAAQQAFSGRPLEIIRANPNLVGVETGLARTTE